MIFRGNVQGVGFRYTACNVAQRYAVGGCVRNLPDGTVELIAEGESDVLDDLVAGVRDAMGGHITDVSTASGDARNEFDDFRVRR